MRCCKFSRCGRPKIVKLNKMLQTRLLKLQGERYGLFQGGRLADLLGIQTH